MSFYIRHSEYADIDQLSSIYKSARSFMIENGNPTQWGNGQPSEERILGAIKKRTHFVCCYTDDDDKEQIAAAFSVHKGPEEYYSEIFEGKWPDCAEYWTVKSFASARTIRGAAVFSLNWICEQYKSIRCDTHLANVPMISLLSRCGFTYCGYVYGSKNNRNDFTKRQAYCKLIKGFNIYQ